MSKISVGQWKRSEAEKHAVSLAARPHLLASHGRGYDEIGYTTDGDRVVFAPAGTDIDSRIAEIIARNQDNTKLAEWLRADGEIVCVQYICGNRYVVPSDQYDRIQTDAAKITAK